MLRHALLHRLAHAWAKQALAEQPLLGFEIYQNKLTSGNNSIRVLVRPDGI